MNYCSQEVGREDAPGEVWGDHWGSGHILPDNVQVDHTITNDTRSQSMKLFSLQTAAQVVGAVSRSRARRCAEAGSKQADAAKHLPDHLLGAVDPQGENFGLNLKLSLLCGCSFFGSDRIPRSHYLCPSVCLLQSALSSSFWLKSSSNQLEISQQSDSSWPAVGQQSVSCQSVDFKQSSSRLQADLKQTLSRL